MHVNNYLKSKIILAGAFSIAFTIVSCGSYQYAGYTHDSIYGDSGRTVTYVEQAPTSNNNQYYQNYFKEKTEEYAAMSNSNNDVFTDIDSYQGDYTQVEDTTYNENYPGWGGNNSDVTINIYGGHSFNSIWWNRPYYTSWGWNYGYGYGNVWGYGFNNFYGWNRPIWLDYGWGWNNPFWNLGYYNNFYFGNAYYGGYYNNYYNRHSLSYNQTRRGALANNRILPNSINRRNSVISPGEGRRVVAGEANRRTINRTNLNNRRVIGNKSDIYRSKSRPNNTSRTRPITIKSSNNRSKNTFGSSSSRSRSDNNISRSNTSSRRSNSSASRSSSGRSSSSMSRSSSSRSSSSMSRSGGSAVRRGNN